MAFQLRKANRSKPIGIFAQEITQLVVAVIRTAQVFKRFAHKARRSEFVESERHARVKVTQNARSFGLRNGPDAEESQHMVNTVGMIELAGLIQAATPPFKVILFNDVPAVRGETPVLAAVAEHVRRSACAVIQREVLAVSPDIGAVFVNQDRNVTLDTDSHSRNFGDSCTELLFGLELHPGLEQVVLFKFLPKLFDILGSRVTVSFPVLPTSFVVLGLQRAIDAIGLGPSIVIDPAQKHLVFFQVIVAVVKNLAEDKTFPGRNIVVINLSVFLEFGLTLLNFIFVFRRTFNRLHVDKHRVQGKSTAGTVGARFGTRVVHRQKLDNIEIAKSRPTGKGNQVQEFTDTDALPAIKTKEGNGHAALEK